MSAFQPQNFGKYQLLAKIAVGGMAELYRAKLTGELGFEKLIAIKKILPHLSEEEGLVKAFIDEAKLAAHLHHENIVQIYDFGSMQGDFFIAMEYLFGKDLKKIIQRAEARNLPLSLANALYIVSRICAGLHYSHQLKDLKGKPLHCIHRDINPQNIFITYEGQVKLIDFGIAKAANHHSHTREGLIKGKLAYMSPEQANGLPVDHRSDIYSTGIVLYELLCGRRMFEGETMHIYASVRKGRFDPLQKVKPGLPDKLYATLDRALARDPSERYQTCGEMLSDLDECIFDQSIRANARGLADWTRSLFQSEMAVEERALWEIQATEPGDSKSSAEDTSSDAGHLLHTLLLTSRSLSKRVIRLPARYALLVLALACSILFDIGLQDNLFTTSDRAVAAYTLPLPDRPATATGQKISAARSALAEQQFEKAISLFEEILVLDPAAKHEIAKPYGDTLLAYAENLQQGDPDRAEALILRAIELNPQDVAGLSQLGYFYVSRQNYKDAERIYQKVARLEPQLADTYFNLGYIYAVTKDYPKAREMYRRTVQLKPAFLDEALFNLAQVEAQLGERDQCLSHLERAISINPQNESAKQYLNKLRGESHAGQKS